MMPPTIKAPAVCHATCFHTLHDTPPPHPPDLEQQAPLPDLPVQVHGSHLQQSQSSPHVHGSQLQQQVHLEQPPPPPDLEQQAPLLDLPVQVHGSHLQQSQSSPHVHGSQLQQQVHLEQPPPPPPPEPDLEQQPPLPDLQAQGTSQVQSAQQSQHCRLKSGVSMSSAAKVALGRRWSSRTATCAG
jgi:hypothetical protein